MHCNPQCTWSVIGTAIPIPIYKYSEGGFRVVRVFEVWAKQMSSVDECVIFKGLQQYGSCSPWNLGKVEQFLKKIIFIFGHQLQCCGSSDLVVTDSPSRKLIAKISLVSNAG